MLDAAKTRFSTSFGWILAIIALVIAVVVWAGNGGWTTEKITLEFVLLSLAILL